MTLERMLQVNPSQAVSSGKETHVCHGKLFSADHTAML